MLKLSKYAVTAFYCVFFGALSWLLFNCLINLSTIPLKFAYVIIGTLLFGAAFLGMYYVYQKINPLPLSYKAINRIILLLIFVALCFSGIVFAVTPKIWDLGTVHDSAYQLAVENKLSHDYLHRYFKRFPNNIGILIFLTVIYKFVAIFGITSKIVFIYVGIAANIIMIFLSILVTHKLCSTLFHKAKATLFLVLISFCLPVYLYASTFYTDTLSMLFPPLILYLYVRYDKAYHLTRFKKIAYLLLIALFSFLGMKMKVTVIIVLFAIAILLLLQQRYLDLLKRFSVIICAIAILSVSFQVIIDQSKLFDFEMKESGTVPYTHWVMMGMTEDGSWNEEDYNYTYSFETVEEAKQGNIKVIKDRLTAFGVGGYVKFLTHKATLAWGDGTYNVTNYTDLYPIKTTSAHEFVTRNGSQKKYLLYFSQCYHIMILLLALAGLFRRIRNKKIDYLTIVYLSLFGLLLFLLIWESKSRYLVHYIPLLYISALDGFSIHRFAQQLTALKGKIIQCFCKK